MFNLPFSDNLNVNYPKVGDTCGARRYDVYVHNEQDKYFDNIRLMVAVGVSYTILNNAYISAQFAFLWNKKSLSKTNLDI